MSSSNKGEQLETYVLLSLTKFKNLEQRLQKAENVSILKTDLTPESALPPPPPSPSPSSPVSDPVVEEDEPEVVEVPELTAATAKKETDVKIGKDQTPRYRQNQIKKILSCIKNVQGGTSLIHELYNIDALIKHALSQSRKTLPHMEEFYKFLYHHGLAHLIRNRHQISKLPNKAPWYHLA